MKSAMPYHGVTSSRMRAICKGVFADYPFGDVASWTDDLLAIWRAARFREERYAAIELADHRRAKVLHTIDALPAFEEMIVSGAWWDYVDALASHDLGKILRASPVAMKKEMLRWAKSDDVWKRRSAIICQLGFKDETDLGFLYAAIEPSIERPEFWLRKAIGWALRQYARTDPEEIVRYVEANDARLSGLSKREAMKHLR